MQIRRFELDGPIEITPKRFQDERGYFVEVFNAASLHEIGAGSATWVQENQSFSMRKHTLRGLHYQLQPKAQAKLIRVLKGRIFDVAVDTRKNSRSFGRWIAVELAADLGNQLFIPAGFAHGFLTLEDSCEIAYIVSASYAKELDRSIIWNDPDINVRWPLAAASKPILSEKDASAPTLAQARLELE